jgi:Ca2+-binding EF-hand superfamily protein
MKKFLICATALMAGTAALAQTAPAPQTPPAPPAPMAHPMADRVMTRAETVAMVREHFAQLDTNKDGAVTTAEVSESRGQWAKHKREMGDPNAAFDQLDANKDGSISRDEFAKGHEQRIERRVEIRKQRQEGAKEGKEARQAMRMHRMGGFGGRMIVMADTNKDGKITLAEAEALALQHFDQMDTNHDGQVTPEERRAGRPMMIKRMQAPSAG